MPTDKWNLDNPGKMREYRNRWAARNPEKAKEARRAWVKRNPEKVAAIRARYNKTEKAVRLQHKHDTSPRRRATRHGMSLEAYEGLLAEQEHRCAICEIPLPPGRGMHVDHDKRCCNASRSCGACVRGVLCKGCNTALGVFRDSSALLRRAADYLDKPLVDRRRSK